MTMTDTLTALTGKPLGECTNSELYLSLLKLVNEKAAQQIRPVQGRKLYYISAEFLIGKLLSNNLINLGLYEEARDALAAAGKRLSDIEEVEPEPSLGNGGLGRLAACFLDSLATLNLPGDGVGLRYHFGLFHQSFEDGVQNEKPDPWLTAHSWAEKTDVTYPVELAGKEYTARLYKLAVTGYEGRTNTLNLFDLDTIDESIVHDGIAFDKTAIDKNLTLFLYPDDSDEAGRRLRVYQQYLMVSAGAQLILAECAARGCNYHDLADYAAIQINDTHPSMVIPELIWLLGERGIEFEEAVEIVTRTCAYTNHTILAEALEKWPRAYLDAVVPQLMPIIEKLDALARTRTKDESLAIIDKDGKEVAPQTGATPGAAKLEDVDGNGVIDSKDRKVIGSKQPSFTMSMGNRFSYKDLYFSFLFNGVFGKWMTDNVANISSYTFGSGNYIHGVKYWTPETPDAEVVSPGYQASFSHGYYKKLNYVQLRNITLGYRVNQKFVRRIGLSAIDVNFSVNNVCAFSNMRQMLNYDNTWFASFPTARSYVLGLTLTF